MGLRIGFRSSLWRRPMGNQFAADARSWKPSFAPSRPVHEISFAAVTKKRRTNSGSVAVKAFAPPPRSEHRRRSIEHASKVARFVTNTRAREVFSRAPRNGLGCCTNGQVGALIDRERSVNAPQTSDAAPGRRSDVTHRNTPLLPNTQ
ncbi:unnamed protein product, partial [Iphiclides podalirius]